MAESIKALALWAVRSADQINESDELAQERDE
jgi:hypothetical protein